MLDPGHGGKDPGAIGVSGTYEKQVALATALELKRQLEASGRYRVELTRSPRRVHPAGRPGRPGAARRRGACSCRCMRTRCPTIRCAAPRSTRWRRPRRTRRPPHWPTENSADRFIGRQWQATSPEVAHILASLVRRETRAGSVRIARSMVGCLDQDLPMLPNPERHAGFVVLKAADIPSVLVEMGFMSNPRDEAALRQPAHRRLVARRCSARSMPISPARARRPMARAGWLRPHPDELAANGGDSNLFAFRMDEKPSYPAPMKAPLTAGDRLAPRPAAQRTRRVGRPPRKAGREAASPGLLTRAVHGLSAPSWRSSCWSASPARPAVTRVPAFQLPTCRTSTGCAAISRRS